jgi:hypothetical protein
MIEIMGIWRRQSAVIVVAALLYVLVSAVPAAAAGGYGELLRFSGEGTNKLGSEFEFEGEEAHAFAAEPEGGRIFVGTESDELSEKLRIQTYNSAGAYEGEALLNTPKLPKGMSFQEYEGFALAPSEGRIYVLDTFKRFPEAGIDPGSVAAGALYAFKNTPSAGGKLEAATGTGIGKEGILGTPETLGGNSETPGTALLEPSGITVDPKTGEILILGVVDAGAGALHPAVEHVGPSGSVLFTWVDPELVSKEEEPDSPAVSAGGELFFEGGDELFALPAASKSGAPELVFSLAEPSGWQTGPFASELVAFGEGETGDGGGLAITAEGGGSTSGRIVAFAEVDAESEAGVAGESRNGALDLSYSEAGGHVSVAELGWTGGAPGEGRGEPMKPCEIGFADANPLVATVSDEDIYVLSPAWGQVIEFGPTGSGCPTAHEAPGGLEVTLDGKRVVNLETSDTATLTAKVVQADVLSVKWIFGDGQEALVTTPTGEETQTAQTTHKFVDAGKLPVEAIIHTDDLATPELHVTTTVDVTESGKSAPIVTRNPKSVSLVEGETAKFEASASGEPQPTAQWEESTDGGAKWQPIAGQTATALTFEHVAVAQSGYEYRATFSNGVGSPVSSAAATLTVETKKAHEEKVEKEKLEEEERLKKEKESQNGGGGSNGGGSGQGSSGGGSGGSGSSGSGGSGGGSGGVAGFTEGSPRATLAGSSLSASAGGTIVVKVSCPAGVSSCNGTVTLRTLGAVSARAAASKKAILTLAQGSFSVVGGKVKAITLHLSSKARSLLARSHSLRAQVSIVASDPSGQTQTVRSTATISLAKHHH